MVESVSRRIKHKYNYEEYKKGYLLMVFIFNGWKCA